VSNAELSALLVGDDYVDTIMIDEDANLVLPRDVPNRFGNHSCEPNLGWSDQVTLVAMRDIAADEELTTDYATSTGAADFVMMCHCETYRCRQVIEGTDWQIPQLQQRYDGFWTPALQRRIDHSHA
jgi:hypothetical protein